MLTERSVKQKKRKKCKKKIREIVQTELAYPTGKYRCIVIDPPWKYDKKYEYSIYGRSVTPYPVMTLEEIKNIPIASHRDCIIFMWTTQKYLFAAIEILQHWGFKYKHYIVWDKGKMGMGQFLRLQTEICLIGMKGTIQPLLVETTDIRDIIHEQGREHSRKPDQFYDIVDRIVPFKKLEYFSRTPRDGWDTWGNDLKKFENTFPCHCPLDEKSPL